MRTKSKNRTPEETATLVAFITERKAEGMQAKQIRELLEWTTGQYEAFTTKNGLGREKRILTNEELKTITRMKSEGYNMESIALSLSITKSTLEKKLQKLGLTSQQVRVQLSEDQLTQVKHEISSKVTQKEIAASLNIGVTTLQKQLKENGIETKLYKVKHDYFSIIDSEDKAYFLGLMYADGYNGEERNQIKLKLHRKDKAILESFAKALTYGELLPPFTEEHFLTDTLSVQLTSEQLCNDLNKLGCMQAKSLIVQLPNYLSEKLMPHFVRGYFDGDGSIFLKTRNSGQSYTAINFTGCERFITQLHNFLIKTIGVSNVKVQNHSEGSNAWQVVYTSYNDIQALRMYFYTECNPELYLKRKFNKFPTQEFSDKIQLEQIAIKSKKVSDAQLGVPKESLQKPIIIIDTTLLIETPYKSVIEASVILNINKDTLKAAIYKDRLVNKRYLVRYQE